MLKYEFKVSLPVAPRADQTALSEHNEPPPENQQAFSSIEDQFQQPQRQSGDASVLVWLLLPLLIILAVVVLLFRINPDSVSVQDSPALGKPAPQLDLVRLSDELTLEPIRTVDSGKVTLLHCWGTWCGPCRIEYPELSAMTRELQSDSRFVFRSVSCEMGPGETFEGLWGKTQEFLRSNGISDEVYADPTGVTRRSLAQRMERESLFYPTSILIDGEGKIAGVWEGYAPEGVSEIKARASELIEICE